MDREILFRGKGLDGEWYYGWYSKQTFGRFPVKPAIVPVEDAKEGYLHYEEVNPNTVGQFTGMYDKHSKKIFEGDIVKKRTYFGVRPCVVFFSNGCFNCGYGSGSSTPTHPYLLNDKNIEVLGNMWDNPELLEEK